MHVEGLVKDYAADARIAPHRHGYGQIVYAVSGLMMVTTLGRVWALPTERAMWIPAGIEHSIVGHGAVAMRTLYVDTVMFEDVRVVDVAPLLRELILHAANTFDGRLTTAADRRVADVLLDRVREARSGAASVPTVREPRLQKVIEALVRDPADQRTIDHWARFAGASPRTLARLFLRHTGMSFRAWREHVRLLRAEALLGAGEDVTSVAFTLGYESPSAFAAMFRRNFGSSPTAHRDSGCGNRQQIGTRQVGN
jgi:AraC-like DNA-binding protein